MIPVGTEYTIYGLGEVAGSLAIVADRRRQTVAGSTSIDRSYTGELFGRKDRARAFARTLELNKETQAALPGVPS